MAPDAAAQELIWGFDDPSHLTRVAFRLGAALILGGVLGLEREREHKAAGMRTHMLVALGSALFVVAPLEAGVKLEHVTRIIQGIVAGIGFIGGGTILKLSEEQQIKGLTTAANIWLAAAVGIAVGLGWVWPALVAVVLAWVVLWCLGWFDRWIHGTGGSRETPG
jgi:putative Mg2+ transporter-C (MgtC) family protein